MPKCRQCGLDVRRDRYGEWRHVDKGDFFHSAEPVDLSGPKPKVDPAKVKIPGKTTGRVRTVRTK